MERLKQKDLVWVRNEIRQLQGHKCPLCQISFTRILPRNVCVDHCHRTGYIRGVLCRNCNGILGKLENLATRAKKDLTQTQWLENAVKFLKDNRVPSYPYIHPTHRTDKEKRALARKRQLRKAKEKNT